MHMPQEWKTCRLLIVDSSGSLPNDLRAGLAAVPSVDLLEATPEGLTPDAATAPDAALYAAAPNDTFLGPIRAWAERIGPLPFVIYDPTPTMLRNSCVLSSGASGYFSSAASVAEVLGILWFARHGGHAGCASTTQMMRERLQAPAEFSEREAFVTTLVALGATNAEVAVELGLSVRAVEQELTRLFRKAGVTTRAGYVAWATLWSVAGTAAARPSLVAAE